MGALAADGHVPERLAWGADMAGQIRSAPVEGLAGLGVEGPAEPVEVGEEAAHPRAYPRLRPSRHGPASFASSSGPLRVREDPKSHRRSSGACSSSGST